MNRNVDYFAARKLHGKHSGPCGSAVSSTTAQMKTPPLYFGGGCHVFLTPLTVWGLFIQLHARVCQMYRTPTFVIA